MAKRKWEQIADTLRQQIVTGKLEPGQELPTNLELMKKFEVHAATVQQAVNALISEGLIVSSGSSSNRRTVHKPPERSIRSCGFLTEAGDHRKQEILELKILDSNNQIPETVKEQINAPTLYFRTRQYKNGVPVAVSQSYLPGILPLKDFQKELSKPSVELYTLMKKHGFNPKTCRESLIASPATKDEQELLLMPRHTSWPVVRITRLVYDPDGNLLEYCLLVDRADCYEFVYEFNLNI